MRYHFTLTRKARVKEADNYKFSKDVEKLEPSYIVGGNVK